jgi:nifR3 family TIM-barrel protein
LVVERRSPDNRAMPLTLGPLTVPVPVVLAPMAGITNAAYRRLCAEQGAGLYVCEMITSRGLVERDSTTLKMLVFDELEATRSVQLYGTDPAYVGKATEILCAEYGVHHVDLNFGCPVPKVTRKGGGGALPWKRGLLAEILSAAVAAAEPYGVPVTMKTRKGLDDDHPTYLDAGRIAEDSGVVAIALHGRTVAQSYSGRADWDAIARLVDHVSIPVLGNGDIWEAGDALRMVEETGAAGVVVGRGCLGRPWLFRDLAAAFGSPGLVTGAERARRPPASSVAPVETTTPAPALPTLGEVSTMMRRHAELLSEHMGEERGCKEFRKHVSWYLKGFRAGGELRRSLALVDSLAVLDVLLEDLDPDEPFPVTELGAPRGRQGSPRERVVLPEGWLDDTDGTSLRLTEDATETTGG